MARKRILITVKTYPTLSKKYGELVCTAGLDEDGHWIRIYPVPFRDLDDYRKFEKYRFIEADIKRNQKDSRPESHKIRTDSIELKERLGTENSWEARRRWVLDRHPAHHQLKPLIHAANKENRLSLATFKPTKINDLSFEKVTAEWSPDKLSAIRSESMQGYLFDEFVPRKVEQLVRKLPYKFRYHFEDSDGTRSSPMIEDWEIGALFWNCLKSSATESQAVDKVRQKYFDAFLKTDLHLFLGTTREWHGRGKNPFVIIGVFTPPKRTHRQLGLFPDQSV